MTYPKIRFKRFSKEWKLTSYKEIASSFQYGLNAPAKTFDGINKYLRITDIDESLRFFSKAQLTTPSADLLHCDNYLLNSGNIVFARTGASVGKSYIYNEEDRKVYFAGFLIRMMPKMEVDSHFVFHNTLTDKFANHVRLVSQRSGQPGINVSDLQSYQFYIAPDLEEQKRISKYLCTIDSQLKECINKISSLKQIKSACLQSMFPQEGESVPKVRFKGFNEEWKKDKLCKFVTRITRKNKDLESNLPLTISAADGLVSQLQYFNNIVASANLSGYYLIKNGEFAYNKSYSNGYPFGSIKRLDKYDMGALSTLYIVFGLKDNSLDIDSDYLTTFFSTTLWHHEVAERAEEGARNHGLLNIGAGDFLDINIFYPKDLAEQQKIAAYFENLDQQISFQTQRLEKLKHIKSACLDKMFV